MLTCSSDHAIGLTLNQISLVHMLMPCFCKLNVIMSISSRSYLQVFCEVRISPICATCCVHLILLDLVTLIILCEEYKDEASYCGILDVMRFKLFCGMFCMHD
jgi:hypothetical protein